MDSPGGGLRRVEGVLDPPAAEWSPGLLDGSASLGRAERCRRDSMICRCWSRTEMLRCNCSRIVGSCVKKPGDKQARPTSCMPMLLASRAVRGLADGREVTGWAAVVDPLDRSSRRGRGRDVESSGEAAGSFLTIIFGGLPGRDLVHLSVSAPSRHVSSTVVQGQCKGKGRAVSSSPHHLRFRRCSSVRAVSR